ncbi:MAG TPA: DUF169 domain-containing protein [Bryobacterales bacterium]|nr:DUF169 domain-containing protein [Bryobacterales bacterium]
MELATLATRLDDLLHLARPVIGIAFREAAPAGVPRIESPGPAGCAYWRLAAEGRAFYTEASDHYGCTLGAHTHNVDLPPEKAQELQSIIGTMSGLEYIGMEEAATLPRRRVPFGVAIYAPLAEAPCDPDVVLVRGNARQIMLVAEAARALGIEHEQALMGRPACAMIPAAIDAARGATSLACIGNRVYTGLADDELYFAIPGPSLASFVSRLETIVQANLALEGFHQDRNTAAGP